MAACTNRVVMKISRPLVIVFGGTGCGKSKLALEIAKKFDGEIINADAMQVYKGLEIVTNKVTLEEQRIAPHHVISCVDPLSNYMVVDFRNAALKAIENILDRKKLPIIVGGTNYYIESIVWDLLVSPLEQNGGNGMLTLDKETKLKSDSEHSTSEDESKSDDLTLEQLFGRPIVPSDLGRISSSHLHSLLKSVDPTRANTLHPQDRRKVIRSLQVYQQHGKMHSELLAEQHRQKGAGTFSGPLRFPNTTVFWVQCDQKVLDQRLDRRVDEMMERGMLDEIRNFHELYNSHRIGKNLPADYTVGPFQTIGFKEFHDYVVLSKEEQQSDAAQKLLQIGLQDTKQRTKRYSRKQVKWIGNRFLKRYDRDIPPVYGLDATDLDKWDENVKYPAYEITQAFLENRTPQIKPLEVADASPNVKETFYCDVCDRIFVGENIWDEHVKSRRHYRRKSKIRKEDELRRKNN